MQLIFTENSKQLHFDSWNDFLQLTENGVIIETPVDSGTPIPWDASFAINNKGMEITGYIDSNAYGIVKIVLPLADANNYYNFTVDLLDENTFNIANSILEEYNISLVHD